MTSDKPRSGKSERSRTAEERKSYVKPAIIAREPLEVLAVVCDPASGGKDAFGVGTCTNRASS